MTRDLDKLYALYKADTSHENENALVGEITRYARKVAASKTSRDTDDIAQEVTWKVWSNLDSYDPSHPLGVWVKSVITNHITDEHRAAQRRPDLTGEDVLEPDYPNSTTSYSLHQFTDEERYLLHTFSIDLDFEICASKLGITTKALRSRLERIKNKYTPRK